MKGHVWQSCHCGCQPVCEACEQCAWHCRCVETEAELAAKEARKAVLRARLTAYLAGESPTN